MTLAATSHPRAAANPSARQHSPVEQHADRDEYHQSQPLGDAREAGAGQRQRAVKLQADGSQALVMEVTRMPLQSGQAVNLEKVLGHMRKLVQIEFLRNGLQTACTSPQPSTTGGLAALETTCTIRQRGAVVMKQTLLAAAGKTSAYSLSYAGLAEAYDASQAEIRAVRESLRFE
ncbi:DUF4946 domain-containing protein [Pseudomonas aeruginosa]|nr:DUF4946 domain-containing protein [Pseudomonas aeruginosa]MBF3220803.1 DUF4946 domain-containing protein [Pseudomonas aeruginosa]MBF3342978.1 DUF4946 domain-containing protein [Pseudomonas aeruginosa]